jgi:hypothetical protein
LPDFCVKNHCSELIWRVGINCNVATYVSEPPGNIPRRCQADPAAEYFGSRSIFTGIFGYPATSTLWRFAWEYRQTYEDRLRWVSMWRGYSGQGAAARKSRKAFHGVPESTARAMFVHLPAILADLYPIIKYSIHERG